MIDFRSDTVTEPTEEMRKAMESCEVGDDVYEDDPTVKRLEELAAAVMGKEAALLVPSGTMGNQLAIMGSTRPTDEVIISRSSHVVASEAGGAALFSSVNFCIIDHPKQYVTAEAIRASVRTSNIHHPNTSLVCVENALGNGCVVGLDVMEGAYDTAKELNLSVHLDGARIFNAATTLGVEVKNIAACADTVMFCVSKGLCAPVGSLLCGTQDFIRRARKLRKLMGAGMRQAGVIAAPGIIAIEKMSKRLHEDHANAKILARGLAKIEGVEVMEDNLDINMVFFHIHREGFDHSRFVSQMLERGIKINPPHDTEYRLVTHNNIKESDVSACVSAIAEAMK